MAKLISTERRLAPEGVYLARIQNAKKTVSGKGNPMLCLTVALEGRKGFVYDFLVLHEKCEWKLKEFFAAMHGFEPGPGDCLSPVPEELTKDGLVLRCSVRHERDARDGMLKERLTWLPKKI